ncbi:hypothetical protein GRI62_14170 [Erythrobacter arachoides]|uniref:Uncharacterized protein n=1 Tax=Aurantiacibacter arachoides TaxID=1850444 RepID=A0A845A537_9SPHN|nr:hypothetical protein [Aurantiacibacter arachoides]
MNSAKRNTLAVEAKPGEDRAKNLAIAAIKPGVRHAALSSAFARNLFGDSHKPDIGRDVAVIADIMGQAETGDNALSSRVLMAQALSLDAMFTELARRSAMNMGEYIDASDRYMRLALKAQANCRATLEALAKLHQPREQTVRHVHVNQGGQAVIADQVHNHAGGKENANSDRQPHATDAAGAGPALLGHDAEGSGLPVTSGQGECTMQDARGQGQRCA